MAERKEAVIISAVRTPTGKFQGALKDFKATELGALVVRESVRRAGVRPEDVDEVIMGCVIQAGLGQNPARQAALHGGIPFGVSAVTINKVCGSGLKAVMMAAQGIQLGDSELVVAGGMESMTNAPYLIPKAREGYRLGNGVLVDAMIHDGLWCAFENYHMGNTGEVVAERYNVTRAEQDEYALRSQQRAAAAIDGGGFDAEIVAVETKSKRGETTSFTRDEHPRADTTAQTLKKLPPVFAKDGTVTAGNSSGITDGAAAVVLMSEEALKAARGAGEPQARIVDYEFAGVAPEIMGIGPVPAIRALLARQKLQLSDIDLVELNEAFAAQVIACDRELKFDPARLNVNGGAIALGHPIGCTGVRITTTLLYEMQKRGARRGLATLCISGGMGIALLLERV